LQLSGKRAKIFIGIVMLSSGGNKMFETRFFWEIGKIICIGFAVFVDFAEQHAFRYASKE